MATMSVPIFIQNIMQHLSFVWVELTLASIAAVVYFAYSGASKGAGRAKMKSSSGKSSPDSKELCGLDGPAQLAMKVLRQGKIAEAIELLKSLPETKAGALPDALAQRLLMFVSKVPRSNDTLLSLRPLTGKLSAVALEGAITEAFSSKDFAACRQLHNMSNLLSIPKNQAALENLVNVYAHDAPALRALVEETPTPLTTSFATIVLEACAINKDSDLSEKVFGCVHESEIQFLRGVVAQAEGGSLKSLRAKATAKSPNSADASDKSSAASNSPRNSSGGDALALRDSLSGICSSSSKSMFQKEVAMRANDIRSCGKNGDIKGAIKVYERLGTQGENTLIVNSMLDACVECKDISTALGYFKQAKEQGLADVVSYNTMMKGYISNGQEAAAKELLAELSDKGMTATRTSFHGLLNARVNARDLKGAWRLVEEMQASGIGPNAVTCSILLKGKLSSLTDVSRVLALIDAMDQPMDEVLFLAVVEACIRTGRLDLLSRQTEKYLSQGPSVCLTAPTFGSMIKAYGHARDVKRVKELWNQMISHNVPPTSITMGCMIEALVANGCTMEAWQLAQHMWEGKGTRPLVNTVIYSSILKGFANAKETDKVMSLYEEMQEHQIQPNTITFNTILNAFAQGNAMHRVPALLEDMKSATPSVEPDIVTYSTIVKGFCNSGSLDRALKVLKDMRANGRYSPDEVMYNSLLSGCAKEHRPDEALQLLGDMKKSGVAPSNYTLSMLVKLMGRCKRLNQAFTMLDDISKEYGLKINIQVYTCLIQGCFNAGQATKAIALYTKIINEGLVPDAMTYSVLVRGCIQGGITDQAVELARCAYGLGSELPHSKGTPPGLAAGTLEEVLAALGGAGSAQAKALTAEIGDRCPASSQKDDYSRPYRRGGQGQAAARAPWKAGGAGGAGNAPWRSTGYAGGGKKIAEKSAP